MTMSARQKAARAAKAAAAATGAETVKQVVEAAPGAPAIRDNKPAGDKGGVVFVVSKMPRGIYLQLHETVRQDVRVVGGGIEKRDVAMRVGEPIRLKPTVLPFGAIPNYPIVDGFSITRDVPANFWRKWIEQNGKMTMVEQGLLAGFDTESDAIAYCREHGKLRTGLEPIAQNGDPRVDQTTNPNVSNIEIDTDSTRAA
jgi:hypothetical protein